MSGFFEEDEPVAEVVTAFEEAEQATTGRDLSPGDAAHMSLILLRDDERAELSREEVIALEHVLHERLCEIARTRGTGDAALLLAIKASDYLGALIGEVGEDDARALIERVATSKIGVAACERAAAVARSVDDAVA